MLFWTSHHSMSEDSQTTENKPERVAVFAQDLLLKFSWLSASVTPFLLICLSVCLALYTSALVAVNTESSGICEATCRDVCVRVWQTKQADRRRKNLCHLYGLLNCIMVMFTWTSVKRKKVNNSAVLSVWCRWPAESSRLAWRSPDFTGGLFSLPHTKHTVRPTAELQRESKPR